MTATSSPVGRDTRGVLRLGGIAGLLGSVLFVAVFIWVGVLAGENPSGPIGPIERFPDIRWVRTVENALYLSVLWVPTVTALHHALRTTAEAAAMAGRAVGLLGLGILAAGAVPHIVSVRLADYYHAEGATPDEQAMLGFAWETAQGVIDLLLFTGLLLMAASVVAFGVAMLQGEVFSVGLGRLSVVLGVIGLLAGAVLLLDPYSLAAFPAVLTLIVFFAAVGRRLIRLAEA